MEQILRKIFALFVNSILAILWAGGITIAFSVICLDAIRVYLFKRF